ncbi:hypothetical protein VPNG_09961 [Cytospora leucostoma]|uniref:Phosphatidylinositol-specific phospholipase C X domain-containing protein n=1 Tax=Cytospora leucostoma TaxID=1230097 RepID=A0A423VL40_9PEZI|nr:hypothetical protein VPNG_09961 [Cytospora leucostoma]
MPSVTVIIILAFAQSALTSAVCNGYAGLCDKLYSNVTFVGSHDSAFVGILPTDNQFTSVSDQLSEGVRFLQAQTHNDDDTIELCHTSCAEKDAGSLEDYLTTVADFLAANPDEVLTLLLTNPDGIAGAKFAAAFEAAGADTYAYTPGSTLTISEWPTLGDLVDAGTRLVVFMDYPADDSVSYILNEFDSYIFETPYDTTNSSFPECSIDRPSGSSAEGRMYLVNHYLDYSLLGIDIPDELAASTTNGEDSILDQVSICTGLYGRNPNFILLDWISVGDAITVQAYLNGVGSL